MILTGLKEQKTVHALDTRKGRLRGLNSNEEPECY